MAKTRDNWDGMLRMLSAYKDQFGHCNVPTNDPAHQQLGRWVAAQRYRRKIGTLPDERVKALDDMGFVWSPSGDAWERMFEALTAFARAHGHCDVPDEWPENPSMVNWIHSQRHKKRKGLLAKARAERLESIGFRWSCRKRAEEEMEPPKVEPETDGDSVPEPRANGERLYALGRGAYVQYSHRGDPPPVLARYLASHDGDFPPYIPLPSSATRFFLGDRFVRERLVNWPGSGALPKEVLEFVSENGTLPRYELL